MRAWQRKHADVWWWKLCWSSGCGSSAGCGQPLEGRRAPGSCAGSEEIPLNPPGLCWGEAVPMERFLQSRLLQVPVTGRAAPSLTPPLLAHVHYISASFISHNH